MTTTTLLLKEYHTLEKTNISIDQDVVTLYGVLQRADALNGNGRIYEKKILEREVNEYQKFISEKRSLGELDHCIKEGAQILTIDGWKDFRNISPTEIVATMNSNGELEYQQITRKIEKEFDGELLQFSHSNIQTSVTPEHRFFLIDRYGNKSFYTAQEIYENRIGFSKHRIPRTVINSQYDDREIFILPSIQHLSPKCSLKLKEKYSQSVEISMDVWSSFLGLYLAEGNSGKEDPNYSVHIYQKIGSKCDNIEQLLNKMPFKWTKRLVGDGSHVQFSTVDMRLNAYLRPLGLSWQKYIPQEMKNLAPVYLQNIIEWFRLGDGRIRGKKYKTSEIFSTSLRLIEDFAEILIKSGGCGNISTEKRVGKISEIRGHKVQAKHDMHFLHLSTTNSIYLDRRFVKIEPEKYTGKVYCVSVPNQTFFCMDNGKIYLSGNCNSTEVNLKNASHIVENYEWVGNELRGRIRLLSTPSGKIAKDLIKDGVTLGISTRGLGSITQLPNGTVKVNEDYHLVCWDLVHDPSTTGAFMLKEGKYIKIDNLNQMITESITSFENKINSIVNDILRKR